MDFNVANPISLHPYPMMISHDSNNNSPHPQTRSDTPQASSSHDNSENRRAGTSTAIESDSQRDDAAMRRGTNVVEVSEEELENQPGVDYGNDPFQLSSKLKKDNEISSIRKSISRRNSLVGTLNLTKDATKAKKVGDFYEGQNENILRLLKPVEDHRREAKEQNESNALQYKIAVHASFAANICLACLQTGGAVSSGSLSLFTTMADALFDPLSNLTLLLCHRAVKNVDPRKFPQGKARIETAGNITFCFIMCAVSLVLIVMSAREIAQGSDTLTKPFKMPSIIAVAVALGIKIALFFYCYGLRQYSQVRILWEDHRNDIIINAAGLCTSVLGSKIRWFIDPIGAIVLSVLIMGLWLKTAVSEFRLLIGVSADPTILQHITYICAYFFQAKRTIEQTNSALSYDTLSRYPCARYCPCMELRPTADCRGRYSHGCRRDASSNSRYCRGATDQA